MSLLVAVLAALADAAPAPEPNAAVAMWPMITNPPTLVKRDPTLTYKNRRDILDDLTSDLNSVFSVLGSDIPSYVASGASSHIRPEPQSFDG